MDMSNFFLDGHELLGAGCSVSHVSLHWDVVGGEEFLNIDPLCDVGQVANVEPWRLIGHVDDEAIRCQGSASAVLKVCKKRFFVTTLVALSSCLGMPFGSEKSEYHISAPSPELSRSFDYY
jgi:hypothetical protein